MPGRVLLTEPCAAPPDSITIGEFMRSEIHGRHPIAKSRNPFTCGLTGKTYSVTESHRRSDLIAKALSKIMGWEPNVDLAWDKVIAVFSFNTVSTCGSPCASDGDGILTRISRRSTTCLSCTRCTV